MQVIAVWGIHWSQICHQLNIPRYAKFSRSLLMAEQSKWPVRVGGIFYINPSSLQIHILPRVCSQHRDPQFHKHYAIPSVPEIFYQFLLFIAGAWWLNYVQCGGGWLPHAGNLDQWGNHWSGWIILFRRSLGRLFLIQNWNKITSQKILNYFLRRDR